MNKTFIRIVAIICAAALVLGALIAGVGSLAGADPSTQPASPPTSTPSRAPSAPVDPDEVVTPEHEALAREALAEFAARLGVSEQQAEQALQAVAQKVYPQFAGQQRPDLVDVRSAATEALADELQLPTDTVDQAVTGQIIDSYARHRAEIDAHLDQAVAAGYLSADQAEQVKQQAADGSVGTR